MNKKLIALAVGSAIGALGASAAFAQEWWRQCIPVFALYRWLLPIVEMLRDGIG